MERPTASGHHVGVRERRRSPRLRVGTALSVTIRPPGPPIPALDLSFGGFAVETPHPFVPGTLHHCELVRTSGAPERLLAQVVRSERVPGTSTFLTAFRFSMVEADSRERLNHLLHDVATTLGVTHEPH